MGTNNRRRFIKNGLLLAASAPVIGSGLKSSFSSESTSRDDATVSKDDTNRIYRKLGNTGIKLPVISMGTGDTNDPKLVEAALQKGIILLATSQYYGNGNNEKMLGEVIKKYPRESFMVVTSAMPDGIDHKNGVFTAESTEESYLKKVNGSLERLGVDHVDIWLLPFAAKRESVFYEPLLNAVIKIKKEGKAKYIGIATHSWENEAIRAAVDVKVYDVVLTQYNFRHQYLAGLEEAIIYGANAGLGIIAMKTMAGAYWDKERTKPIDTRAALKWVLQNPNIHTTVPGFTTFQQLQQNIDLMKDVKLNEEEKNNLKMAASGRENDVYCQQCGQCIEQCPYAVDIPTIMRSYMYAYGYKNLSHAQQTLHYAANTDDICSNCTNCSVQCSMGHNIRKKILDISRLSTVPGEFLHT